MKPTAFRYINEADRHGTDEDFKILASLCTYVYRLLINKFEYESAGNVRWKFVAVPPPEELRSKLISDSRMKLIVNRFGEEQLRDYVKQLQLWVIEYTRQLFAMNGEAVLNAAR
ncbi:hypothetical protein EG68_04111 [Paragonimus skrjabini miyazakii]|uniref:Uncharacterized protein n=1 Tax=Paragonimus skrjabini miyazakii TaxID=59628 RepID=A0A8S9YZM9_9TREM|nr:hypothetical protein EG68_04111 [Paragonimus skrjabini miyazakii]